MFIELTPLHQDTKELTNINFIKAVGEQDGKAIIATNDERTMYFEESYSEVKSLIAKEVAAERGY